MNPPAGPSAPAPGGATVAALRARFPAVIAPGSPVALDNAATTHKPEAVLEALRRFYVETNANVHRANHRLGMAATEAYEGARRRVARFLGARPEEVVFTRGATDGVNLVARAYLEPRLGPGDVVVVTALEHHSNLLPWRAVCQRTGARLAVLPVDERGQLQRPLRLPEGTRLLAAPRVSNALGTLVPVDELVQLAQGRGAAVLLDITQALAHLPLDDASRQADFLVLSAHKAYGPMGLGVLRGRAGLLADMEPVAFGGEMVEAVDEQGARWQPPPARFEAGTPPAADAVAFAPALDLLDEAGLPAIRTHELALIEQILAGLARLPGVEVVGPATAAERAAAVSFVVRGGDPHVLATVLDLAGVAIRAGWHCAEPLLRRLGRGPTARASVALYNTSSDVERLLAALPDALAACR